MSLKNQHTTADFLSWKENKRVIKKLYDNGDYYYCLLFVIGTHFGLRISDIKTIKWDDLIRKERIVLYEQKTGKKKIIETPDKIKDFVLELYGYIRPNTNHIITQTTQAINRKLKRLKKKYDINIDNFSTHTFRKTFGRYYWEKNNYSERALIMLSEMFNHSSIATTKRYLGIKQEEFDNVYNEIAEAII